MINRLVVWLRPIALFSLRSYAAEVPDFPVTLDYWLDLPCGRECPKSELGKYAAVLLWPYDATNGKLKEMYALRRPIFIPDFRWRTTLSWSLASTAYAGALPEPAERSFESLAADLARDVWATGRLPFTPFWTPGEFLDPRGTRFWSQFVDWSLDPYINVFTSLPDLADQLTRDLSNKSDAHDRALRELEHEAVNWWRALFEDLLAHDLSRWKA